MSSSTSNDDYCGSQVSIEISEAQVAASQEEDHHIDAGNLNSNLQKAQDCDVHNHSEEMAVRKLVVESLKDGTILLLMCCASLSLLIDARRNGSETVFVDGATIFLSIFFVATFGNIYRFLKTRWILRRSSFHRRKERSARVAREGHIQEIQASQIVDGDVVFLEAGDHVPADGRFLDGTNSCKIDGDHGNDAISNMFTGAKVVDGSCRMLVTSVGENTERSKLIGSLMRTDRGKQNAEESKFQNGFHRTTSRLEKIWLSLSLIILIAQVVRCFFCKSICTNDSHNPDPKGVKNTVEEIMNEATKIAKRLGGRSNGLVSVLCVLVFATRDGFPLGLFVLFFNASNKMKSLGKAMVQKLSSCATLGLVTTLCLTRTDDLTLNHAKMGELWVGFNRIKDVSKELNSLVLGKLQAGIFMNSSGCDQMEDSLLLWAHQNAIHQVDDEEISRNCSILNGSVEVEKDRNLLEISRIEGGKEVVEMHWKGELERILSECSHYYDADGTMQTLDEEKRAKFSSLVSGDNERTRNYLQCFAFAYKRIEKKESSSSAKLEGEESDDHGNGDGAEEDVGDDEKTLVKLKVDDHGVGWILTAILLLKNPFPPELKQAVQECRYLGINVKLLVDDDAKTARIMGISSGIILNPQPEQGISESAVMEGSEFRNYPEETRMKIIDKVHVIANATPLDKLLMVQCLKKKGEEVAITGSNIRDLPSLIEADVGIFLSGGDNIPQMAKEDADIIITRPTKMGEIAKIIWFGKCVCQRVSLFLELHMILNFCAISLNLISEVWKSDAVLSSAQLLWTNLVMEALGAFAVAVMSKMETSPSPSMSIHRGKGGRNRTPFPVCDGVVPEITKKMWRNVAIQTFYQVTILTVLEMKGKEIFHVDDDGLTSMIFNSYILCQIAVLVGSGAMKMDKRERGYFQGPPLIFSTENLLFLTVVGMILALQILMIETMVLVAHWGHLDLKRWSICIGAAGLSAILGCSANWLVSVCCF